MAVKSLKHIKTTACVLTAVLLTACGAADKESSQISIDKEGKISYQIYEEFSEDYYDVSELSDMASSEVSEYNAEYISEKISLESVESVKRDDSSFVKMVMNFDSSSDFTNFNQEDLFYGTVDEAKQMGYTVSKSLVDKDGDKLPDSYLGDHGDSHIIITTDKADILAPFNIEYMTEGVVLQGKKEAELSEVSADTVQLLLSK